MLFSAVPARLVCKVQAAIIVQYPLETPMLRRLPLFLLLTMLCACGAPQPPGISEADSATLLPKDAKLADIYQRSCKSCHIVGGTGAPLTGDKAAWNTRMQKGTAVLLNNVINGFGGMPPLGLCMDCSEAEFEALILFMAGREP